MHAAKQAYECHAITHGEVKLERVSCKAVSTKFTYRWSYYKKQE